MNPRYEPFLAPFQEAARRVERRPWFDKTWRAHAGPFQDGEGVWLGLWRPNWDNDDLCGVHFELSLEWGGFKMGHFVVAMHVLHRPAFSGTDKDRNAFSTPFVNDPAVRKIIRDWRGGYRVSKGGMVPFRVNRLREGAALEDLIVIECDRLRQLGPEIDRILKEHVYA